MARLLDAPPGTTTEADEDEAIGISFEIVLLLVLVLVVVVVEVVVGVPETPWPFWHSTGFLERWRPLFMCRSQYFWSATASLEHRHFLPSVLRHLPGSGSVLLENPRWKEPHPTSHTQTAYKCIQNQEPDKIVVITNRNYNTNTKKSKQENIPNISLYAEVSFLFSFFLNL